MGEKEYIIKAIGYVRHNDEGTCLELFDKYLDAINGLEGFSYINVLWWANQCDGEENREVLECEKPYQKAPEKLGILATRSPIRPNPILLSAAYILRVNKGKIYVPYIDAEDGTPIIDIKPYHPSSDRIRNVEVPEWCEHWPKWYEDSAEFDWEAEFVNAR